MPPTEVRPQTFAVLQQPDSASPAVRFQLKLLGTCCLVILPVQAVLVRVLPIRGQALRLSPP